MNILLIGCVASSHAFLDILIERREKIVGVVTKQKSSFNSDFYDLTPICIKYNIPVFYYSQENYSQYVNFIQAQQPDIIYCFGWSHLLKRDVIEIPPKGVIGFHPAHLPSNKGRHPLIWAIVLGLKETASTFFYIDEKPDNGGILEQTVVAIENTDDAGTLYQKVMRVACQQLCELTDKLRENRQEVLSIAPNQVVNSWRKRSKTDGKIDFRMSAKNIHNLVRALVPPYPCAYFSFGEQEIKVTKTRILNDEALENDEFGKIISVKSPTNFTVKTGDGLLEILQCDPIELRKGEYL